MAKIHLGSADWNFWPLTRDYDQIFQYLKALEISNVEIGIYEPSKELTKENLENLLNKAENLNINVTAVLFSLIQDFWEDGALSNSRSNYLSEFEKFLSALETHGIKNANVWTGVDLRGSDPEGIHKCLEKMNFLAASYSGTVSIEYKEGTYFHDAEVTLASLEEFENLKILLDTGHAYALNEDPVRLVQTFHKVNKLGAIHLGDAEFGNSDDDLPCGRLHDFDLFVKALQDLDLSVIANFDLYGAAIDSSGPGAISIVKESLSHLKDSGL